MYTSSKLYIKYNPPLLLNPPFRAIAHKGGGGCHGFGKHIISHHFYMHVPNFSGILPIRHETLSHQSINQSINQSFYLTHASEQSRGEKIFNFHFMAY